jgi:hypothetical protein
MGPDSAGGDGSSGTDVDGFSEGDARAFRDYASRSKFSRYNVGIMRNPDRDSEDVASKGYGGRDGKEPRSFELCTFSLL